jgi:hypothetical protein
MAAPPAIIVEGLMAELAAEAFRGQSQLLLAKGETVLSFEMHSKGIARDSIVLAEMAGITGRGLLVPSRGRILDPIGPVQLCEGTWEEPVVGDLVAAERKGHSSCRQAK